MAASANRRVKVFVTDVDKTLLSMSHDLPPGNAEALKKCLAEDIPVVIATGKAPGPWLSAVRKSVGLRDSQDGKNQWTLNAPAVYLQGCIVYDKTGELIQSVTLEGSAVEALCDLATVEGVTICGYTPDGRIVTAETDKYSDMIKPYREAEPEAIGADEMKRMSSGDGLPACKMIIVCDQNKLEEIRPKVDKLLGDQGSTTTAVPCMLEILPRGISKGAGVKVALEALGISPAHAAAIGDGENDLSLLTLVKEAGGVPLCVGNACQAMKEMADEVMPTNDDGGVAAAISKYVFGH